MLALPWVKRGQMSMKRFKSLMQFHTGGIDPRGKKENQVAGVEIRLETSDLSQISALRS